MTDHQNDEAHGLPIAGGLASSRRGLLRTVGLGGAALGALSVGLPKVAHAQSADMDVAILNFALNLEYLEAEFYLRAVYGFGLGDAASTGTGGSPGQVTGGQKVTFSSKIVAQIANEIANDELHHVKFLRSALGSDAVARPALDLSTSFTTLARAAGLVGPEGHFNPFLNDDTFLLGAFIFEDVGVTAYNGAAPAITNKTYLGAAASILAVEAYHASEIRLQLLQQGMANSADKISKLRGMLSAAVTPGTNDDQGIIEGMDANIVPTDDNGLAFARTTGQVLSIVYGAPNATAGLFFPNGLNGTIT